MLHVHYFITRKAGMTDAEFHRYWRETHGPIASKIPQLHRYVQSHRIPAFGANSPYDGEADERKFIDLTRVEWMVTRDHVVLDGPTGGKLVKGVWQLAIKPGMALEEFRKYWLEVHGPMALKLPGIRRYVQSHLIDEAYLYATPRFDGVAQLWFDSVEAFAAAFASPAGNDLMADGRVFIDAPRMTF